ncbi:MAG: hypothetical protein HQM00_05350 [Magnetococcales bacterium]|nr:hypothetical protein [Magnetococcales bacterium]
MPRHPKSDPFSGWRTAVAVALLVVTGLVWGAPPAEAEYADVVLNRLSEANGMRPVIYPHWFHRIRFRCKVCHSELGFKMRAGSNDINMMKLMDGKYCGMCHNNNVAWGLDNCHRCHSGRPGMETGVRGGHKAGGPGFW